MKNSKRLVIGILISLILIFLSSCSDLLMQLGEHGNARLGFSEGLSVTLQIQVSPETAREDSMVQVEQGTLLSFSAVADSTEELALTYRWFLDGEELTDATSGVTLDEHTLELDTSVLPIGNSEVNVVAQEPLLSVFEQKTLTLTITMRSH
ncbi:hypothetical protein [uncultured Sphaerochaeta sp.]|uniref:hypothetical protein n=1 Tax=uncultured Sphaerochaeta sp. TaxID=886478 RepID=UPI002A0A32F6|nr:hypothetical protein [uncultured Sphaerochaeta sp.]